MTDEIALFIDFENIRYSLINVQHREPDPQELIGVARRYGTVMVARAYADWSRQPEFFKGSLTAAMIDRVDCPAKVRERFRQPQQSLYSPPNGFERPLGHDEQDLSADDYSVGQDEDAEEQEHDRRELAPDLRASDDDSALEDEVRREPEYSAQGVDSLAEADDAGESEDERDERLEEGEDFGRRNGGYGYQPGGFPPNSSYFQGQSGVITQSTVDLNMLMDIIETVFDRPSINTFVLMSGDRDFTRICARLKLRLNKRVIVVGVPGTVSRDLISAAEQFIPLGVPGASMSGNSSYYRNQQPYQQIAGPVEPEEPGFIQFLDYIDRHWSWRTVGGVANFIGDAFNPKNRFRGRLTRDSARELLRICIDEGILILATDQTGNENLRLNRDHPAVVTGLSDTSIH